MEIVGYLVYVVNTEVTAQDVLYQNRVLYPKWEDALMAAGETAHKTANEHAGKAICLIRDTSKSICHNNGYTTAYRLNSVDILIFPVLKHST